MFESATSSGESERWLPVLGFVGLYEVSDLGNTRSLPRKTSTGMRGGKLLKPGIDRQGYSYVNLWRNGKPERRWVHRMVLEAFVEPCPPGQEGRHGPGGNRDNRLVNLCWGTRSENAWDKLRDGTLITGEQHGGTRLTVDDVSEIRRRVGEGEVQDLVALDFEISCSAVSMIASGKRWKYADSAVSMPRNRSERGRLAKLTAASVAEIRVRHANGERFAEIAATYRVTSVTIRRIINGETWRSVA